MLANAGEPARDFPCPCLPGARGHGEGGWQAGWRWGGGEQVQSTATPEGSVGEARGGGAGETGLWLQEAQSECLLN